MINNKLYLMLIFVLFTVLVSSLFPLPANAGRNESVVSLHVSENGFIDKDGNRLTEPLKIPKKSVIKIIFEYADLGGDVHEFALLDDSGNETYSDIISEKNRQTHISFLSGEEGEQFELYCILSCDAMAKLSDLIVLVV